MEHEYQHPLSERKLRYPKAPIDIHEKRTRSKSVDAIEKRRVENQYSSNKADSFQFSDNNGQDIPLPISLVDSIDDYILPEEYDDLLDNFGSQSLIGHRLPDVPEFPKT